MLSSDSGRCLRCSRKIRIGPVRVATSGSLGAIRTSEQSESGATAGFTRFWRRRRRPGLRNSDLEAPYTANVGVEQSRKGELNARLAPYQGADLETSGSKEIAGFLD